MTQKRTFSILFSIILITLIFAVFFISSCNTVKVDSEDKADRNKEAEEIEREFVFALSRSNIDFDPIHAYTAMESQVYTAIYEGIVTYNPITLNPMPGAASRWDISEDRKTYRFYIRDNAFFSDNDPVSANDFKASWLRILDPDASAEFSSFFDIIKGAREYRLGKEKDPHSVAIRVISDKILEVELESPAAHFLKLLCHMCFVPIHPNYHKEEGWDKRDLIVGNGPFFIYEKNEGEIIFEKNNLYWDSANVKLDRIIFKFYEESEKLTEAFNLGNIDWAVDWDGEKLEDNSMIVFNPMFATNYFFFKCVTPPWDDFRVRRALTLLLPWSKIRNDDEVLFKTDRLVPAIPDYPEAECILEADQEQAFALLSEAGFPQGKGLPEVVIKVSPGGGSERIARIMEETWKESLKIDVNIVFLDYKYYFESLKKDDYTLGQMTWIGDFADPLTFLQMWTGESNLNDAGFSNPEYDSLVKQAIAEEDGEERYKKFSMAESIVLSKAVVLPISNQPTLNLIDLKYIKGWYPNPLDLHPFKYIHFKEARQFPNLVLQTQE